MKDLDSFILKGIFTTYTIKDLQSTGTLVSPLLIEVEKREVDTYSALSEKTRSGSIEMSKYYRMLFALENSVRDLINDVFEENLGNEWFEKKATGEMKKRLELRKQTEAKNRWHTGRNAHPIFYLDFGDLALLITNSWELFKDFFPDQHWINSRMTECERSRNVIAHTNILPSEEGERLLMYLKDIISQIG
jgi:hypothetical protein